jgi:hypothetical protein
MHPLASAGAVIATSAITIAPRPRILHIVFP